MAKAKAKSKTKSKNSLFTWEGTNKQGQSVKGEMMALNADVVKAEIRKQGLMPKKGKIKKKTTAYLPQEKKQSRLKTSPFLVVSWPR